MEWWSFGGRDCIPAVVVTHRDTASRRPPSSARWRLQDAAFPRTGGAGMLDREGVIGRIRLSPRPQTSRRPWRASAARSRWRCCIDAACPALAFVTLGLALLHGAPDGVESFLPSRSAEAFVNEGIPTLPPRCSQPLLHTLAKSRLEAWRACHRDFVGGSDQESWRGLRSLFTL